MPSALGTGESLSPDDFDALKDYVELFKKQFGRKGKDHKKETQTERAFPVKAMWKNKDSDKPVKIMREIGAKGGVRYFQSEDGTGIPENELTFEA